MGRRRRVRRTRHRMTEEDKKRIAGYSTHPLFNPNHGMTVTMDLIKHGLSRGYIEFDKLYSKKFQGGVTAILKNGEMRTIYYNFAADRYYALGTTKDDIQPIDSKDIEKLYIPHIVENVFSSALLGTSKLYLLHKHDGSITQLYDIKIIGNYRGYTATDRKGERFYWDVYGTPVTVEGRFLRPSSEEFTLYSAHVAVRASDYADMAELKTNNPALYQALMNASTGEAFIKRYLSTLPTERRDSNHDLTNLFTTMKTSDVSN